MKIEVGKERTPNFKEWWENQYEVFSHFEYACGIPHTLFAITTFKDNGKPNVSFHSWSSFGGEGSGFYAIMAGLFDNTHAYKDILRTGEFCINFMSAEYYDRLIETISKNDFEADEFVVGGFTQEKAKLIDAPRIKESFLSLECKLHSTLKLNKNDRTSLVIGEVINIAIDEDYARGIDKKYSAEGFMFNIHAPKNMHVDEDSQIAIAACNIIRNL